MPEQLRFVANKLGLENILLLNNQKVARLSELSTDTFTFFKKLPGYQTLRLLLCKKAVLVEGDSDELVFQKAYMEKHNGHLPIEDGIDVISVKLTFKRFLNIAVKIGQQVAVITDNDCDFDNNITQKYKDFEGIEHIKIFADKRNELNTLEPQMVDANKSNLGNFCAVLDVDNSKYNSLEKISKHMEADKPAWALKVFESQKTVQFPEYIRNAVAWCDEN